MATPGVPICKDKGVTVAGVTEAVAAVSCKSQSDCTALVLTAIVTAPEEVPPVLSIMSSNTVPCPQPVIALPKLVPVGIVRVTAEAEVTVTYPVNTCAAVKVLVVF